MKYLAMANFSALGSNRYPGRLIVTGMDEPGENLVELYALMGRSENSRNRIFVCGEDGLLATKAADESKVKDRSLIIYNAMREVHHGVATYAIVSNGDQTDVVADGYATDSTLEHSMHWKQYEPDNPNYTPRITAVCYWLRDGQISIRMAIARRSQWSGICDRNLYEINDIGRGFGRCLHTYMGDGDPLPSFRGEPYVVPLLGDIEQIAGSYWEVLDPDNRVALAVKFIPKNGPSTIGIINKLSNIV